MEKPDFVIGLFHSGWNGGISTLHYNEDATEKVAKEVDGFDLIIFGHDHNGRNVVIKNTAGNKVLCLDPSCNATFVADATLKAKVVDGKENFPESIRIAVGAGIVKGEAHR